MVLNSGYWSDWDSPIQDYVHPDDQTQPTFEMTPGFKPFTNPPLFDMFDSFSNLYKQAKFAAVAG